MKTIDDYYKEWSGVDHTLNSCHPVHDSAEACDFAEYYHYEMVKNETRQHLSKLMIEKVRKEISLNIKKGVDIQEARKQANIKYGKGWRERGLVSNSDDQWDDDELRKLLYHKR